MNPWNLNLFDALLVLSLFLLVPIFESISHDSSALASGWTVSIVNCAY